MRRTTEFEEFISFLGQNADPPAILESNLITKIRKALNPPLSSILAKLFLFHVLGSLVTLVFCPQFGLSLFAPLGIVPDFLMRIHPALCFFGCGLTWMLGGQGLAYAYFTIDEQRVLGRYRWGTAFTIILLTILLFACVGEIQFDEWFLLWLLGGVVVVIVFNWLAIATLRRLKLGVVR